jgi:hypothetical protein
MADAAALGRAAVEHRGSLAAALQAYDGDTVRRGELLFRSSH